MAPFALIVLAPGIIILEPEAPKELHKLLSDPNEGLIMTFVLACNVFLAFFVNLFNFLVTHCTSALTLQV